MALTLNTFANQSGTVPASQLDANFAALAGGLTSVNPRQFGAKADGGDDTAAVQACLDYAFANRVKAFLGYGPYTCFSDVVVPTGNPGAFAIEGPGWSQPALIFDGTNGTVVNGLYSYGGTGYGYASTISNLYIECKNNAPRGITDSFLSFPVRRSVQVWGASGVGWLSSDCNIPVDDQCQVINCGDATHAQREFLRCTVVQSRTYVSTGRAGCQAGIKIDQCNIGEFRGAINNTGICIMVDSRFGLDVGSNNIDLNYDLEEPVGHYVEAGYGLSGAMYCTGLSIAGYMQPSGTPSVPFGIKLNQTNAALIRHDLVMSQSGSPTAAIWLEGATNVGVVVEPARGNYGSSYPWVMVNGAMVTSASPLSRWGQNNQTAAYGISINTNGSAPSALINTTQGGVAGIVEISQSGATNVATMTGALGNKGIEIDILPLDSNTTLTKWAAGVQNDAFIMAANLTLASGQFYRFRSDGIAWRPVTMVGAP